MQVRIVKPIVILVAARCLKRYPCFVDSHMQLGKNLLESIYM
jgi:hypothetical protein